METFGSASSGKTTPYWISTNTYGLVPINSNNAYLRGSLLGNYRLNRNITFNAATDLVGSTDQPSAFFAQQLFGEVSFQSLFFSVGQKEYYNSMLNRDLSSGDFNYSTNARPIPEIRLSIPNFTPIPFTKKIVQIRGDFSVGKSIDNNYILNTKAPGQDYAIDILWHHKSLFLLLEDPQKHFPFSLTAGIEHAAQWGGWTSESGTGTIPHSFSDFIKIVLCEGGGDDSTPGDQANVLGNHQGTFNARLAFNNNSFNLSFYKQHYFDDNSGVEYANWRDGIWGLECKLYNQSYVNNIVAEFINTTNQSGPIHFLYYERPARGGGNDDYYNHDYYISGWSYFGRTLGNPLITSPAYNNDGTLYLKNNRVKAIHLGLKGNLDENLSYRILTTGMHAWGRMSYPFLERKTSFSSMLECNYILPKANDWKFSFQLAFDNGSLYGDNIGASIKVSKSGLLGLKKSKKEVQQ